MPATHRQGKFSAAPRKDIDTKLLKSADFLVVGSIGRVSSWKLPYRDSRGRVNVHLLELARQIAKTGKTASGKKDIDFTIPPAAHAKIEELWAQAKLWHKVYGRDVLDTKAAAAEEKAEALAAKRKAEKKAEKAKEKERAAKAAAKAEALARGDIVESSDEEGAIGDLAKASASGPARVQTLSDDDDDGEGGGRRRRVGGGEDDEEAAFLREYEQEREAAREREKFWRRGNDFIDDDEDESADEGGKDGGESDGSEALEHGQKGKAKEVEIGVMNSQQVYDMLHSESQRMLRKATSALPCTKHKTLSIGAVLHKIERRRAEVAAPPPVAAAEEEDDDDEVDQLECVQVCSQGHVHVHSGMLTYLRAHTCIRLACAQTWRGPPPCHTRPPKRAMPCASLTLAMVRPRPRQTPAVHQGTRRGRHALDRRDPARCQSGQWRGTADLLLQSLHLDAPQGVWACHWPVAHTPRGAPRRRQRGRRQRHGGSGGRVGCGERRRRHAVRASRGDDHLLFPPPSSLHPPRPSLDLLHIPPCTRIPVDSQVVATEVRESRSQLQKLISADAGGGAAVSRRFGLRRQLRGSATTLKKEEARSTGRYVEVSLGPGTPRPRAHVRPCPSLPSRACRWRRTRRSRSWPAWTTRPTTTRTVASTPPPIWRWPRRQQRRRQRRRRRWVVRWQPRRGRLPAVRQRVQRQCRHKVARPPARRRRLSLLVSLRSVT